MSPESSRPSSAPYRFGDLLALARQSWLARMKAGLSRLGYHDYRRTDAFAVRLLLRGPISIGRLGEGLGVTRQAARKVADGLERRGYATVRRAVSDARQLDVALTDRGESYARAITKVIERLNRDVRRKASPDDLAAADRVLRAVLTDGHGRALAERLPPPRHGG